jgi:hypothetical protein
VQSASIITPYKEILRQNAFHRLLGGGGSPELKNDVSAARCPAHTRATKRLFDQCFAGSLRHAGAMGKLSFKADG